MKKLKAVLILLLALVMSLALFACGGGKDDNPGGDQPGGEQQGGGGNEGGGTEGGGGEQGGGTEGGGGEQGGGEEGGDSDEIKYARIQLRPDSVTLTDSDEKSALEDALAQMTISAQDLDLDPVDVTLENCNYNLDVVKIHEVGEYSFEIRPKDGRAREAAIFTVVIEHDWEVDSKEANVKVCQYEKCKARQTTTEEDVVIHYGAFHDGTGATVPSVYDESSVYTNNKTTSNISEFGSVNGRNVPTLTAGKLEPGMTITISGKVMTSSGSNDGDGPWGHANENYNSPTLGIADRSNNGYNADHRGYGYGISVLVRQEGWVLYNGIGKTDATSTLAGVMGGFYTSAGGWRNYGSHSDATEDTTPGTGQTGYVPGEIPTDWSKVNDWWVYSTGSMHRSMTAYYYQETNGKPDISKAAGYEYTWNYREDGVIEISYTRDENGTKSTLKAYIKVPDSPVGYYDTVIHGDYNDMTITKSVVTSKRTPTKMEYRGLVKDANSVYAENKPYDSTTLNVEVRYEQTGDAWNTLQVSIGQVYRYLGELTRDQLALEANKAEFESVDPEKWVSLSADNSLVAGGIYKIHIDKGGMKWDHLIPATDLTVLPNRVDSAEGADVTVDSVKFPNNDKLSDFEFSVDAAKKTIVLKLVGESYVQTLTAEQTAKLTGTTTATKYVALRLNAAAHGDAFTTEGLSVKKGDAAVAYAAVLEGDDLYLVLALTEGGQYTIEGLQGADSTPVVLDLTELKGFSVESKVEKEAGGLPLNKGGTLTLTYTVPAGTKADALTFSVDGNPTTISYLWEDPDGDLSQSFLGTVVDGEKVVQRLGSCTLVYATYVNGTLTLKLEVPAADLANYAPIELELSLASGDVVVDYVDYDLELNADVDGYVAGSGDNANHYVYASENGKLSVVRAIKTATLANGSVSGKFSLNINNGNEENFRKYGLTTVNYSVADGNLILVNAPAYVSGYVQILGTYGDDRDTDLGAYVVITVDVSGLGITGDYYFNFAEGRFDAETKPTKILKVSGTKISEETVAATDCESVIIIEGSCQQEGLYAWAVTVKDAVVFYANAAAAAGAHVGVEDGVCDLCGATFSDLTLTANEYDNAFTLNDGDFIEVTGKYNDVAHADDYNGVETNVRNAAGAEAFYVRVRNDGYYKLESGDGQVTLDYNSTSSVHGVPNGTCNGVPNGIDGTPITSATYAASKQGGSFKVYAAYADGVVTVTTSLWLKTQETSETPYFTYTVKMTVVEKTPTVHVNIRYDNNGAAIGTTDTKLGRGYVSNSTITEAKLATVGTHTAPADLTLTRNGNVLTLTGNAGKEGSAYYAALEVTFEKAIVANTQVYVRKADGSTLAGATATLDSARTKLSVYVPLTEGLGSVTVDLVNFEGNTLQGDIVLDVSKVVLSDVKVTASKTDLNLGGDTFDLTYTGTIPTDAKLQIGADSVELSALAGASATSPVKIGGSLYSVTKYDAAAKKVSFKYDGVSDYTKDVAETEILLVTDASVLCRVSVYPNTVAGLATQVETSGWYLVAAENRLVLVSGKASATTLPVVINAGQKADPNAVATYDLAFNGNKFVGSNVVTAASVLVNVTLNGKTVTAIVITLTDLTGLGITADGAYGFMLATEGATKYYAVSNKTITEQDATTGTQVTVSEQSCDELGKTAKANADKTFYWDVQVSPKPTHTYPTTPNENGDYVCTVCGAVLHPGNAKNHNVPATSLAVEGDKTLVDTGLSVSFYATSAIAAQGSDWQAFAIVTGEGNAIITLPNLDPWNITASLADEAEEALAAKLRKSNCYPVTGDLYNGSAWNVFNGTHYVTITLSKTGGVTYYCDGVKVIAYAAERAVGSGTAGDFAELVLRLAERTGLNIATGATINAASDLLIEKKAYTDEEAELRYNNYLIEKEFYPAGEEAPTHPEWDEDPSQDHNVTIGATDNSTTSDDVWSGRLAKGEKIVFTGTHTSVANATTAGNWNGITFTLYSGLSHVGVFRPDDYIYEADWTNGTKTKAQENWEIAHTPTITVEDKDACATIENDTKFWASMRATINKADLTITFDWSDEDTIAISFVFVSTTEGYENTFTMSWTITASQGNTLADEYTIGFGADAACAVLKTCTRTPAAKA